MPRAEPVGLRVPAIGLHTDRLLGLGLTAERRLEAPGPWEAVGWYADGAAPGQEGTAILAGHVDSDAGPAVFHGLHALRPGDEVAVDRADGTAALFTVYAVESYRKDAFPSAAVYGAEHGRAELRLITCAGRFDTATRHYDDNLVVYARHTGAEGPPDTGVRAG
jgi:sortase (surface protein transpeptidase)